MTQMSVTGVIAVGNPIASLRAEITTEFRRAVQKNGLPKASLKLPSPTQSLPKTPRNGENSRKAIDRPNRGPYPKISTEASAGSAIR